MEAITQTEGWAVFRAELERRHDAALSALTGGDPSDHARLAKATGRLAELRETLAFPAKVIAAGVTAAKELSGKRNGDSSSDDEE
jgi:hypothetical protein